MDKFTKTYNEYMNSMDKSGVVYSPKINGNAGNTETVKKSVKDGTENTEVKKLYNKEDVSVKKSFPSDTKVNQQKINDKGKEEAKSDADTVKLQKNAEAEKHTQNRVNSKNAKTTIPKKETAGKTVEPGVPQKSK